MQRDASPGEYSRRQMLQSLGGGIGMLGAASILSSHGQAAEQATHFAPRAKRVIHLFMNGGPFQGDTFDPKPLLQKYAGKRPEGANLVTERPTGGLLPSPFAFKRRGESGVPVSELLPQLGGHIDDICVLRSMHADNPNHGPALLQMNNGTILPTRPSMGAWFTYGLGTENENLPGYVVLCPGRPVRFSILWNSAFLPSAYQGTYINHSNLDPAKMVPYLRNAKLDRETQRRQIDLMQKMNAAHRAGRESDPALDARMLSMETAYRMQFEASDAFDLSKEPKRIRDEYGSGHYAHGCLLGVTIIWVALLGVAINTATAVMFLRGREKDINIRAAFLHMAADALVSLAEVAGGVAIIIWQWYWLDPVLSITIAIVILFGTWGLLKDSLNLALHAVPHGINAQHVLEYLQSRPGVSGVHDLHIWAISTTESALTAHIVAPNLSVEENNEFLFETEKALRHEFEISHMTLQIERADDERQCHQLSSDSACRFLP